MMLIFYLLMTVIYTCDQSVTVHIDVVRGEAVRRGCGM